MQAEDFGKYRKAAMTSAVMSLVLAVSSVEKMNWAGIALDVRWAWTFLLIAQVYFAVLMWLAFDLELVKNPRSKPLYKFGTPGKIKIGNLMENVLPWMLVTLGILNSAGHLVYTILLS